MSVAALGDGYVGWGSSAAGAKGEAAFAATNVYMNTGTANQITFVGTSSAAVALKGLAAPSAAGDAATKQYVDNARAGLYVSTPVDYASTSTFATKASKVGSDTDITPSFQDEPATLTITGTAAADQGHTMDQLFNASSQVITGTLTFKLDDTILIRSNFATDYTGLSANNAEKCFGKWRVSTYTDAYNMVLSRTSDMQSGEQFRNGASVMVKEGAQAGNIYFQSKDFDRNLIDSGASNANLLVSGAHAAGATTIVTNNSGDFTGTAASLNYSSDTLDAVNLFIPQGTGIIIGGVYYVTSGDSGVNKNIVIEGGLTGALSGGESIRIGICMRGADADDVLTGVSNVPQSSATYGITWTQFSGGGSSVTGVAQEITVVGDAVGLEENLNKTNFTTLTLGMTSGSMSLQLADSVVEAFKINQGAETYLSIDTNAAASAIVLGSNSVDMDVTVGANTTGSRTVIQCGTEGFAFDFDLGATGTNVMNLGANLADAFSIVNQGVGDLVVYDTTTGAVVVTYNADLYADAHLTNSDIDLKKDIETVDGALSMVEKMRGVTWNWKKEKAVNQSCGVIAQELQTVLPCAVREARDEKDHMRVNYNALTGVFIEAIKELKDKVEALEQEKKALQKEETSPKTVTTRRYNLRNRRRTRV